MIDVLRQLEEYGVFHDAEWGPITAEDVVSGSVVVREPELKESKPKILKSRRAWVAVAAGVITLLFLGLLPFLISGQDSEPAEPVLPTGWIAFELQTRSVGPVEYADVFVVTPGGDPIQISPQGAARWDHICPLFSPDGSLIAYGARQGVDRFVAIGGFDSNSGSVTNLRRHVFEDGSFAPCPKAWSPDGSQLVVIDGSRSLVLDVDTFEVTQLPGTDLNRDSGVAWSPGGDLIVYTGGVRSSGVWLVAPDGESLEQVADVVDGITVSWSPDGSQFLVGSGLAVSSVFTRDGTPVMEVPGAFAIWSPDGKWIAYWGVESLGDDSFMSLGLWLISPTTREVIELDTGSFVNPPFRVGRFGYPAWSSDSQHVLAHAEANIGAGAILAASVDPNQPPIVLSESSPDDHISGPLSWQPNR